MSRKSYNFRIEIGNCGHPACEPFIAKLFGWNLQPILGYINPKLVDFLPSGVLVEILEKTPTKLILRHRPLGLWFVVGICVILIPFLLITLAVTNTWIFYLFWFPLLPIFSILFGVFIWLYAGQSVSCSFDKTLGIVTLKQQSLRQTKVIEFSLRDIIDVELDLRTREAAINQRIVLVLRTGHAQPLSLNNNADWKDKQATINTIREFLGMPVK